MNWISLLFYYALTTAVTGDVMLFIWWICKLLFVRWNPDMIYYTLRWVAVMFLLPTAFSAILLVRRKSYILEDRSLLSYFVFPMNFEEKSFYFVVGIWFMATIINFIRFTIQSMTKWQFCKGNIPEDDPQAMILFEQMKKELHIKGNITLLRNDLLVSPIVIGIFRRFVILPYQHYEPEELRVIFTHELLHFKKHDLIYKALSIIIVTFQSFNPPAYMLNHLIDLWSEQDCDRKTLARLESEGLTSKDYFALIWKCSDPYMRRSRDMFLFSMLNESREMFERRVDFMEKYGNNKKKTSKLATAMLVASFVLASTTTAYAAGTKTANVNDEMFKQTQVVGIDNEWVAVEKAEPFMVSAEENALVTEICPNDELMVITGDSFDWSVPVGTRYVTPQKWLSKGTKVSIAVTVTPSDCTYWYGLMYPSGSSSVCEITGASAAVFEVPSSGFYRILVENRSNSEIRAVGGYQY